MFPSSYFKAYSVIYDAGSVPRRASSLLVGPPGNPETITECKLNLRTTTLHKCAAVQRDGAVEPVDQHQGYVRDVTVQPVRTADLHKCGPPAPAMCSGSEAGSHLRRMDVCITQL